MISSKRSFLPQLLIILCVFFLLQACGEDNRFTGPDYSEVPEPFDTTGVADSTTSDGLQIYFIEEGSGPDQVIVRDQIQVRYTGRTQDDGDIFDSTYGNGSTAPRTLQNLTTESFPSQTGQSISPLIDGFRRGLLGMREGERRTIVIPPHLGYGEAQEGTNGHSLSGETLIFDVELVEIL